MIQKKRGRVRWGGRETKSKEKIREINRQKQKQRGKKPNNKEKERHEDKNRRLKKSLDWKEES